MGKMLSMPRTLTQLNYILLIRIYLCLKFLNKMIMYSLLSRNKKQMHSKATNISNAGCCNIFTDKTSTFQISWIFSWFFTAECVRLYMLRCYCKLWWFVKPCPFQYKVFTWVISMHESSFYFSWKRGHDQ